MIFCDTNVIVDVTSAEERWREWSLDQLTNAVLAGPVFINAIVFAELSPRHKSVSALEGHVTDLKLTIEPMAREVLFRAGQVFAQYRLAGGPKLNVLADFFVGAHAEHLEIPLLTRDTARYRTYFPRLELITP